MDSLDPLDDWIADALPGKSERTTFFPTRETQAGAPPRSLAPGDVLGDKSFISWQVVQFQFRF